jgi:hypothetical protein
MKHLNPLLLKSDTWKEMLTDNQRMVQVSLTEIEQVLRLARHTPGLAKYEKALHQLSIFFDKAFALYRKEAPDELSDLVALWERYSAAVLQRYTGVIAVELRAADHIVSNIFARFLSQVPNQNVAYAADVIPLVYGGEGGLSAYFTHPPDLDRPFAIINLPHSAFANVWQWLALPHEIGHDLYATVKGLDTELEAALGDRMRKAVQDGEVKIPEIDSDLTPYGHGRSIKYSPGDFLAALWQGWANESQGDMMGLINCGGATIVGLQQIIGFGTNGMWRLRPGPDGGVRDEPEPHPVSYVRNALNIAGLRLLGQGHKELADEIEERFNALRPADTHVAFKFGRTRVDFARIEVGELVKSAQLAAEVLLKHPLKVLGDKSYSQIATFTEEDQEKVDSLVEPLSKGDSTFASGAGIEARHALGATVLAFERDRANSHAINRCFKHFLI